LGDLNRSTNRLRRKFDPTDKWMETKAQVEKVVDDGRKIDQVVARGSYGPEAARLWAVLRTGARVWRTADGDLTNQASRIGCSVAFKRHRGLVAGARVRSIARPNNDTAKKELIGIDLGDC
jgi:hypothetical protein